MGETNLGIAHLRACQGKSYSGHIRLTPKIMAHAVRCDGLLPSLEPGEHTTILMMTCAPLTVPEDLKLLLKEGLAKLHSPGIIPCENEALQFYLSPGEPGTHGHYLLVGLSPLSGAHMRLHDVLLF